MNRAALTSTRVDKPAQMHFKTGVVMWDFPV